MVALHVLKHKIWVSSFLSWSINRLYYDYTHVHLGGYCLFVLALDLNSLEDRLSVRVSCYTLAQY
jgi:hypothetical protein